MAQLRRLEAVELAWFPPRWLEKVLGAQRPARSCIVLFRGAASACTMRPDRS